MFYIKRRYHSHLENTVKEETIGMVCLPKHKPCPKY